MKHVACPLALHPDGALRRLAVFEHPQAGLQLVNGRITSREATAAVAARTLFAKSGLETTSAIPIGVATDIHADEVWHFALCRLAPPVRDQWQHPCADGGGNLLRFSWMPLDAAPPAGFDKRYLRALDWIKATL